MVIYQISSKKMFDFVLDYGNLCIFATAKQK